MTDPNPEPDSLSAAIADDGDAMPTFDGMQWHTPDAHHIDILIDSDCWPDDLVKRLKMRFCQMLDAALAAHEMTGCAVSLLLCSDAKIRQLNHDHRGKDIATNVLSFPAADEDDMPYLADDLDEAARPPRAEIGDIAIAHDTCMREADDSGISIDDHVTHLFGHGVLHLLGYDHEQDADATEMEALEISLLNAMGIANPYGDAADDKARIITSSTESAS